MAIATERLPTNHKASATVALPPQLALGSYLALQGDEQQQLDLLLAERRRNEIPR
jgi:hypothetical protein